MPSEMVPPSYEWAPPAVSTQLGQEAVELAAHAGLMLDEWQAYALERILAEDGQQRPAAFEAALIVPRQNGKGSILEALSLAWLFLTDAPLILHSAHEFKTAADGFRRVRGLIRTTPKLARRVERVTTAAGNEAIELETGQRLRYVARSKGSGRGFTAGKLILDEAYAIEAEEMAALLPTLATQPEGHIVYASSAGMVSSDHLRSVRNRGRAGGDPGLCYLEWGGTVECLDSCVHLLDDDDCALNDRREWRRSNPAYGIRIESKFIANERRSFVEQPEKFARERMGIWDDPIALTVVSLESWADCTDETSKPTVRPVFGIDVAPGSRSAAITATMWRPDGLPHVEVVAHAPGTEWVARRCADLLKHRPLDWALDPAGPAGALLPDLALYGVEPRELSSRDLGQACEAFASTVAGKALRHLGDPILSRAIAGAGRRDIGDGLWAWSRRKSETDICPLVAATIALWALSVSPLPVGPPPAPEMVALTDSRPETSDLATAGF